MITLELDKNEALYLKRLFSHDDMCRIDDELVCEMFKQRDTCEGCPVETIKKKLNRRRKKIETEKC